MQRLPMSAQQTLGGPIQRKALEQIYGTIDLTIAQAREIAHQALEETDHMADGDIPMQNVQVVVEWLSHRSLWHVIRNWIKTRWYKL